MILVAGGAGYIGSHFCKALRREGVPHVALDNLEKGHAESLCGTDLIQADLRDRDSIRRAIEGRPITLVAHFAASIEVGESVADPAAFWMNNTIGAWNLLEEMRRAGIERFIFSSTAAVYGEPQVVPIPEDHPKVPTSPYGETKLAVERMLESYDKAYGLKSVRFRYFNACGADPDGEIGEDHRPESHLIPLAIFAALGRRPALRLFGTDYPTPDGTCIRDYVHVDDLAEAHVIAARHLLGGGESRVYNLGSGQGFSVREVLTAVEQAVGRPVPVQEAPRRPGDPARLVADSQAIRRDWGWAPKHDRLEDIARHAARWFEKFPEGYSH
ncbi:MAG: UDP-glucose 4-epimerase GalE [Fimbriimonadaceae bacterium]|nr:UDP-glucose 4-epimerase GalE [Fimbriimonadaceae bacterium]